MREAEETMEAATREAVRTVARTGGVAQNGEAQGSAERERGQPPQDGEPLGGEGRETI